MDYLLENISDISIDAPSRATRWKNLRAHLRGVAKELDSHDVALLHLQSELSRIRDENQRLTEIVRELGELANEEVQREKSLKLNDVSYEIVVDEHPQEPPFVLVEKTIPLSDGDLLGELKKLPGIGAKTASGIAAYVLKSGEENARIFAQVLLDVNLASAEEGGAQQVQLHLGDEEGRWG